MTRYAVYFAPAPESRLWRFGCAVLGYDAATGRETPFPDDFGLDAQRVERCTAKARTYGFHATLKAPFELAEGVTAGDLMAAAEEFASRRTPFRMPPLRLDCLRSFLALVPAGAYGEMDALAADCVRAFEPFRAPLKPVDRARRLRTPLDARELELLDVWGYPHVLDTFRFHMTLSGPMDDGDAAAFRPAVDAFYQGTGASAEPVPVDAIAIYRQPHPEARFVVERRFRFVA